MMATLEKVTRKRTQRDYTLAFKLSVVDQIEKGDFTYQQIQQKYSIQGRSTVLVWLRKHGLLDWSKPMELPVNQLQETPAQIIKRLEKALEDERIRNLILNGMIDVMDSQYGTDIRKKLLAKQLEGFNPRSKGIQPSMTDGYDCYQNALAERVNGILKQEFLVHRCKTMAELNVLLSESIAIYNRMRPHLSLGYQTPEAVHRQQKASCETQLA